MNAAPVLRLVTEAERRAPEQFILRPFYVYAEAATSLPVAARYWCRKPAAARRSPMDAAPAADLWHWTPQPKRPRRTRKERVRAPRKLQAGSGPRSVGLRPLSDAERRQLIRDEWGLTEDGILQTRPPHQGDADCEDIPRTDACPWVGCPMHLYTDIGESSGALKINFPDKEPWELEETCAIRAARKALRSAPDDGDKMEFRDAVMDCGAVGKLMNLTRERIRQIEAGAKEKAKATVLRTAPELSER